jgi:hypothetical protein
MTGRIRRAGFSAVGRYLSHGRDNLLEALAVVMALEGRKDTRPFFCMRTKGDGDVATAAEQVLGYLRHGGRRDPRRGAGDTYGRNRPTFFIEDRRTNTTHTYFDLLVVDGVTTAPDPL